MHLKVLKSNTQHLAHNQEYLCIFPLASGKNNTFTALSWVGGGWVVGWQSRRWVGGGWEGCGEWKDGGVREQAIGGARWVVGDGERWPVGGGCLARGGEGVQGVTVAVGVLVASST